MTYTYKATVTLRSGAQEVTVQADTSLIAKDMIEAQYGKGSIRYGPVKA